MYTVRVLSEIDDRLDAEYYNPEALVTINKMETKGSITTFGSLVSEGYRVVYHGTDSTNGLKDNETLPFLSPTQIDKDGAISFENTDRLPIYYKDKYPKGLGSVGEILVEVKGNVSKVGIIPRHFPKNLMISGSLYKATLDATRADSHYILAFLKSKHGQTLKNRLTSNTIINNIAKDALYSIPIIELNAITQKYIGDKVRQAEQLRNWAGILELKIKSRFKFLTDDLTEHKQSYWVKTEDLQPYRINPKEYDPVTADSISKAKQLNIKIDRLNNLVDDRGIAGGATPSGANYYDNGVLFCRVQNVKNYSLDLTDAVYIKSDDDEKLKRSRCNANDIVLTITGYPGTASLVLTEDLPVNLNQHSVRFGSSSDVKPGYLCAALNSDFLKLQINRSSIGGTRDALDYPSVKNLLIPRLEKSLEDKIHNWVINYIKSTKFSEKLTDCAKTLVEALIEGRLTEEQLIQAQQALEDDDNTLDKAILSKLSSEGYAVEGATPLFSDIDELYSLLASANASDDSED